MVSKTIQNQKKTKRLKTKGKKVTDKIKTHDNAKMSQTKNLKLGRSK